MFTSIVHPGIDLTYQKSIVEKAKHSFSWEANLGYMNHRFFQRAIRLNGTIKYDRNLGEKYTIYGGLGGGYWHSIYNYEIFQIEANGVYEKVSTIHGRPQFSAHIALGITKQVVVNNRDNYTLALEYRGLVHGVLAASYVPIVPYNSLALGLSFPTSNLKKDSK